MRCGFGYLLLATSSSFLKIFQPRFQTQPAILLQPPRMKLVSSKLFLILLRLVGASSFPTLKLTSVGEVDAKLNPLSLSRNRRTLDSLNPAFLFEAVRGLANILQGLSSFLFTGTSAFGLLNLFKPGGGAGADSAGQLLGGALPGGLGGIQDIGGGLTGILGNLSPKSSKAS